MPNTIGPRGPFGRPIRFDEENYPLWRDHFSPESRREMIEDDLFASESVSLLLMCIVVTGLCLGVTAIMLAVSHS